MLPYIGGKSRLANWIISNFPKDYQNLTYIEVFGGAGWVLFKKDKSILEIYNDIDEDLVNLFLQIRDNYKEFKKKAYWSLHSRHMFKIAKAKLQHKKFEDDIDRAVQFAIIQVQSFSGTRNSWGYRKFDKNSRWIAFLKRLGKIRKRLERVQIECKDF
ncbi:MAG: DNA adenine methylase, partial [Aquificae bacterium]|nr:DNA adenine methylase [Aquificota bacterium]